MPRPIERYERRTDTKGVGQPSLVRLRIDFSDATFLSKTMNKRCVKSSKGISEAEQKRRG